MFLQNGKLKRSLSLVAAIIMIVQLAASIAFAHSEDQYTPGQRRSESKDRDGFKKPGIDERLGGKIPLDLIFLDEHGKAKRLADLISGPTIILPVYYGCTNVCNLLQGGLAMALPTVGFRPATDYRVISISFDETETPELASKYKKTYLAAIKEPFPENGWHFLTGDRQNIARLTDSAGYRFEKKGRDFIHPVVSIVVAGDGTIVRYLYGTNFLPKDISLAILEARQGKIGKTVRTVVGYCFSFDPEKKSYVFNLLRVSATAIVLTAGGFLAFLVLGTKKQKKSTRG